jgi:hypothetical protein
MCRADERDATLIALDRGRVVGLDCAVIALRRSVGAMAATDG